MSSSLDNPSPLTPRLDIEPQPAGILRRITFTASRLLALCRPRKLASAFRLLIAGDLRTLRTRFTANVACSPEDRLTLHLQPIAPKASGASSPATAREQARLSIPAPADPLVSIIVAPQNRWNLTHACVASVVHSEPHLAYEIILVDDSSTESSRFADCCISGTTVVRHKDDAPFPARLAAGVAQARGKYLCFLQPNIQVQSAAISSMVEIFSRKADAGMLGGRVVRPNGDLAEAGCMIRGDGSIHAYGRSSLPTLPEYNYFRECDTFAGDAFVVPTALWQRLGGLDEHYASTLYAIADLSCRIRASGSRVYFQPKAVAVRLNNALSDDSQVRQASSRADGRRFRVRWGWTLATETRPTAEEFRRTYRSGDQKTVVFIDRFIPKPDQDAGSRTLFQYLLLAAELGYNVKYMPADFIYDRKYAAALEASGIEMLAGDRIRNDWQSWFRTRCHDISAVLFCRPDVTERFLDGVIEACPTARRCYYGHDLHWVREEREYAITGDPAAADRANDWRRRECRIIDRMDCNLSISNEESRIVAQRSPDREHVVFPVFYWDDFSQCRVRDDGRTGFLFVGGFAHRPNFDGLAWFLDEVWPLIRARLPFATLHVAGSHPPQELLDRNDPGLVVCGFVDDNRLVELYETCRVAVVPLRFGAGVKGKTVEAMRHGVPVVSTSIGIEGLPDLPAEVQGCDDALRFATEAITVHEERDHWARQVHAQIAYIRERFSRDRAAHCLRLALEGKR